MKPLKAIVCIAFFLMVTCFIFSCQKSRYQKDADNKLSKPAKKADDFIAKQSIEITQENIEKREVKVEKSLRKLKREQRELISSGKKIKKEKGLPKHNGDFKFY